MRKIVVVNGLEKEAIREFIRLIQNQNSILDNPFSYITDIDYYERIEYLAQICGWRGDEDFITKLGSLLADYSDLPYETVKNFINKVSYASNPETSKFIIFVTNISPNDVARLKEDFDNVTTVFIEKEGGPRSAIEQYKLDNILSIIYDYAIVGWKLEESAETFFSILDSNT